MGILVLVIANFADATTADIFNGVDSKAARKVAKALWSVARRKLDMLNAAAELKDLATPGNNLEKLKADRAGSYSIRINDQFRVVFKFAAGTARDVQIVDYH
jgi:proteic killer suppression protein